jgi:hypothetical protein
MFTLKLPTFNSNNLARLCFFSFQIWIHFHELGSRNSSPLHLFLLFLFRFEFIFMNLVPETPHLFICFCCFFSDSNLFSRTWFPKLLASSLQLLEFTSKFFKSAKCQKYQNRFRQQSNRSRKYFVSRKSTTYLKENIFKIFSKIL